MYSTDTEIRVRYGETDQMGVVYHGNYARYYEVGRVEALRKLGLSYRGMEESGIMMQVLEIQSRFIKPAYYDDVITVRTLLRELPSVRISFDFELYNPSQELIHTAKVELVFVRSIDKRPVKCPDDMLALLQPYF